ncbi:hypothetical protein FRACYDRAFT_268259 [Fragilariopsis cylindrus CCMP1102]|uniref:Uncharacterized protein n=1 Tax=Fragilariopsis cylindrus CCMP1102 TaxID=635003 RepID=A0A1E7FJE9_9STRA|nr:hypothetical protein FRACYDRAFT_268259 [Fragilariopsis cylindrus CCMP1102]|eukprot:OEU18300.1 hypothetical protein FRACYDRAFT_268259 [Fragilariopsis cylindrus CCMP1102]
MNLPSTVSTLLVSISFWKTIGKNPKFMVPMTTAAFSTATATTTANSTVRVKGSGVESVNTHYEWTPATVIPPGFETVCVQNRWGVESTWKMLNNGKPWLRASNDAYIYLNSADGQWWIDKPDGDGVYVAPKEDQAAPQQGDATSSSSSCGGTGEASHAVPPATGWRALSPLYDPAPLVELIENSNINNDI